MKNSDITADAVALQERDEFRAQGWTKLVAPAKVNLHLAIGAKRPDGLHEAVSIMHALTLHDIVYIRRAIPGPDAPHAPLVRMVSCGDVIAPDVPSDKNLASKAVLALAEGLGRTDTDFEIRIEKNIPAEGGLGGGSSDAAAALIGAAHLWGLQDTDPALERVARAIGSDVAFFLHGGCSRYGGKGDVFERDLAPSKRAVALVKPNAGVSTAEAYRAFDESPVAVPSDIADNALTASTADQITLFNNLAHASEALLPELAEVRTWLLTQDGVEDALLCGSGATSFALCGDFAAACSVVAEARKRGYWARATSLGSLRAMRVS